MTPVSHIFIMGSTDGLGLAAARTPMDDGHEVILHTEALDSELQDRLTAQLAGLTGISLF